MGTRSTRELPAPFELNVVEPSVQTSSRLELALPATRETVTLIQETAERYLCGELDRCGAVDVLADALIALQEATSNVVRHAYRNGANRGTIVVRVEVVPNLLRFTILDEGPAYDPDEVPPPDFAHPRDGGYGLHLMRMTMSKVACSRRGGRNVLVMEKALSGEASDGGA